MGGDNHSAHWIEDCNRYHGKVLTGADQHWCWDWDGLPVDATCVEYGPRTCGKTVWGRIVYFFYEWGRRIAAALEELS